MDKKTIILTLLIIGPCLLGRYGMTQSNCESDLGSETLKIKKWAKTNGAGPRRLLKSSKVERQVSFEVDFGGRHHTNRNYAVHSCCAGNDWNKLMKISKTPNTNRYSVRLGWRSPPNSHKVELALYGHIDHTDDEIPPFFDPHPEDNLGREWRTLDVFVGLKNIHAELRLAHDGLYATAGEKAVAFRRKIQGSDWQTGISNSAYFEDDGNTPPDKLNFKLYQVKYDCDENTLWEGANIKKFANSEFRETNTDISQKTETYNAEKKIVAPVDAFTKQTDHLADDARFCTVYSGAFLYFRAGEKIDLKPGFTAKAGSNFTAEICPPNNPFCKQFYEKKLSPSSPDTAAPNRLMDSQKDLNPESNSLKKRGGSSMQIKASPNPSQGKYQLTGYCTSECDISIFDPLGKEVYHFSHPQGNIHKRLDISHLKGGIYLMEMKGQNEVVRKKLMITK